jgi:hypothetical protein
MGQVELLSSQDKPRGHVLGAGYVVDRVGPALYSDMLTGMHDEMKDTHRCMLPLASLELLSISSTSTMLRSVRPSPPSRLLCAYHKQEIFSPIEAYR